MIPRTPLLAALLFVGAMATKAAHYQRFASTLAKRGVTVGLIELRGVMSRE